MIGFKILYGFILLAPLILRGPLLFQAVSSVSFINHKLIRRFTNYYNALEGVGKDNYCQLFWK